MDKDIPIDELRKQRWRERRVVFLSSDLADKGGRCYFAMFWMDDYFPGHPKGEPVLRERGQYFYSNPEKHTSNPLHFQPQL